MKKLSVLILALIALVGCGEDLETSDPAIQGKKNYEFWRAEYYTAVVDETGRLTISGGNNLETISFSVPSASSGNYVFGNVSSVFASFKDANGIVYSTTNEADSEVSVYPEYGEMNLEVNAASKTVSGDFRFVAFNESGMASVGFNEGIIYNVPISGTVTSNPYNCEDAEADVLLTQQAYVNADTSDSEAFAAACMAYRAALENQQAFCGDMDNAIQDVIDALGECQLSCEQATQNREDAQEAYWAATVTNYVELCQNYAYYLNEQLEICGSDPNGEIQAALDALDCGDEDGDGIPNYFEEDVDTDGDGTMNYMDSDDDGDGVPTSDEINQDGSLMDTDGDSIMNYLDVDDDGDGVWTIYETVEGDTNGDGEPDYLDTDDDGDGVLTADENPDLNGDGNPDDAADSDLDGTPDYLQA